MATLKKIIRTSMMLFLLLLMITGVFKFLEAYNIIGYIALPLYWVNFVHDWSGIIVVFLTLINIAIAKIKISETDIDEKRYLGIRSKIWFLIILLILAGTAIIIYVNRPPDYAIKQLIDSQVTEYQGEKLSSIVAIEDNTINGTQNIDINSYLLEISGLVDNPKSYTYEQVLNFQKYSKVVELDCVEGWKAKILWEGVLVKDLLESAGIKPQAKVAIFYAKDGYTTSLTLDYIKNSDILLAYKMNNVIIPAQKGFPFQLVAEQKWGYKWIKWITKIELSDDINYKGTWEQAGYSNNGDLNGPKMGN